MGLVIKYPILALLCLVGFGACVFLSVTLFKVSSDTSERVLSIAWPLNALALWLAAVGLLCVGGSVGSHLMRSMFGFSCLVGGFLSFVRTFFLRGFEPLFLQ
jgi:hypothetical protein